MLSLMLNETGDVVDEAQCREPDWLRAETFRRGNYPGAL